MQNYTGTDPEVNSRSLFAQPSQCASFMGNGQLAVTEFIRHHNTLAHVGLLEWTDPEFENTLRTIVGYKFFHLMGQLDMDSLNELVETSLKQKLRYLDYPTECNLRRLLERENKEGHYQQYDAQEHLRAHREFYKRWEIILFGNMQNPKAQYENPVDAVDKTATSKAARKSNGICGLLFGIVIVYLAKF